MKFIDLKGEWKVITDGSESLDSWRDDEWVKSSYVINIPDSINHARIGKSNHDIHTDHLTDEYEYYGNVWFSREIETEDLSGNDVVFYIEKTRITTVYVDGVKYDTLDSLCTPHSHEIKAPLNKGKHRIDVCVNNTKYRTRGGHMTSPDTQTNWTGMLGKVGLCIYENEHVNKLNVYAVKSGPDRAYITVCAETTAKSGDALFTIYSKNAESLMDAIINAKDTVSGSAPIGEDGTAVFSVELKGDKLFWDEYERNLFSCSVRLSNGEEKEVSFGIRTLKAEPLCLKINDTPVYLRGKHDGMVFPLTGYAPMEKEEWIKVFNTAKEYGINHYRFHTCCPPEAAFVAADETGIYLEPELPFWGTVADEGEEGFNRDEQEYLISEGNRILEAYGNHPSFIMLSMGNELWGSHKRIGEMLGGFKKKDPRHLYSGGSNNFQFYPSFQENEDVLSCVRFSKERLIRGSYAMCDAPLGYVQTDEPGSMKNYDDAIEPAIVSEGTDGGDGYVDIQYGTGVRRVKAGESSEIMSPATPVISHETGQFYFYPDFDSVPKYTGNLKPTYLEAYSDNLKNAGVFDNYKAYYKAAGKHAVNCYRADIEALMMSEKLSGFQMLDLQDFPGQDIALVGILDAFYDNKGFITPDKWREFCSDTVVYICMPRFVYGEGDNIDADIRLTADRFMSVKSATVTVRLCDKMGQIVATEKLEPFSPSKRVYKVGSVSFNEKLCAGKYFVKADCVIKTDTGMKTIKSDREIWIYENSEITITESEIISGDKKLKIAGDFEDARKLKEDGLDVICIPQMPEDAIEGTYCTDFWNYSMFSKISESLGRKLPVGTLGLFIRENNYLDRFVHDYYSTPGWYNIVMHSHAMELKPDEQVEMVAEVIDNPVRAKRLALLYVKDGIPVCSSRLWEIADKPEVKAFANSLLHSICKK